MLADYKHRLVTTHSNKISEHHLATVLEFYRQNSQGIILFEYYESSQGHLRFFDQELQEFSSTS